MFDKAISPYFLLSIKLDILCFKLRFYIVEMMTNLQ